MPQPEPQAPNRKPRPAQTKPRKPQKAPETKVASDPSPQRTSPPERPLEKTPQPPDGTQPDDAVDKAKKSIVDELVKNKDLVKQTKSKGDLYNFGLFVTLHDAQDPEVSAQVCEGLATATTKAIQQGIKDGKIKGVSRAEGIARIKFWLPWQTWASFHQATYVELEDGRQLVFDWHSSGDLALPEVSTRAEWCAGSDTCELTVPHPQKP